MKSSKVRLFRTCLRLSFFIYILANKTLVSTKVWIWGFMQKIRVKIAIFETLTNGWEIFAIWVMNVWKVQNMSKGVLSCHPTHMFISQAIMKKSILKILSFWAIFTVFLRNFPYYKTCLKSYFFGCRFFGWECWRVEPMFSGDLLEQTWHPENILSTRQHSQPKKARYAKSDF